ncbi:MAG: cytidine deaminase [Spirochaetes bacterium]|nr:cytidine deaminase [Spirochaetota bacterium]
MDETLIKKLINLAKDAQKNAHCPYSSFPVGAALLCENGNIYTGCNVENASYGLTICAERTAVFKAVSKGEKKFKAIAIVLFSDNFGVPCGACRQVLREFGTDMDVIMAKQTGEYKIMKLSELLPESFGPENLK